MTIESLLATPSELTDAGSTSAKCAIVLMTRIRLARNLAHHSFPGWAEKAERDEILASCREAVSGVSAMRRSLNVPVTEIDPLQRQILVERHLISRELSGSKQGAGVVINKDQSLSVMINEEDHLRMQSIRSGLDLRSAYAALDQVDAELEQHVRFAFDKRLGYLTACPTNLGTGMRASAMLHLPGLVLSEQINKVIQAVNKIGLAVRGLYGEGTEALSNLFQISNQNTLGERESDIIVKLGKVIDQIITHERNARRKLVEDSPKKVFDHIGRAYATLRFAHILESKEALTHLSMLRLGADLHVLPGEHVRLIDSLLVEIQPAHLQIATNRKLSAAERDILRAETLRLRLKDVPEPDMSAATRFLSEEPPQEG